MEGHPFCRINVSSLKQDEHITNAEKRPINNKGFAFWNFMALSLVSGLIYPKPVEDP